MKSTTTILSSILVLALAGSSAEARGRVVKTPRLKAGVKVTTPKVKVKKTAVTGSTIRVTSGVRYPRRIRVAPNPTAVVVRPDSATIDFDVEPEESKIYVDGRYRGTADDFDGFPDVLSLKPGEHEVRIETPDGRVTSKLVELASGAAVTVDLELD